MAMTTKKPARLPSQRIPPLALQSKQRARPTVPTPEPDLDPLGFAQVIAEISAQLEEAYYAQLRAFLRKFVLVEFEPAVRLRIRAAETAEDGPVTLPITLTIHPRDASGFPRLVGALETSFADPPPDEPDDAPEFGPYIVGMFGDKIPLDRLNQVRGRKGRRR